MTSPRALRSLKRTPAFTIAAAGSMFAIVYGVLLAPLPYGDPDRLVGIGLQTAELRRLGQPPAVYDTYRRFAQRLDDVGYYRTGNANIWIEGDGDAAERVIGESARRGDHMRQHRLARDWLQHLGPRGFHALALACGEDHDVQRFGHGELLAHSIGGRARGC